MLVAGLWLDGAAWRDVVPVLEARGHRVAALTLPGQGDGRRSATLEEQRAAVVAAVDAATEPVMLVGHSAAATLVWMAADSRPDRVARVVMIGGFPSGDGETYFGSLPAESEALAFPGWEEFEGPDAADLDPGQRAAIAARAIPVPAGVVTAVVSLRDERRFVVPVALICPEFSPDRARGWVEGGEVPELARARDVSYVDIESGHWPMFSRPQQLGDLLAGLAAA